MPALNTVPQPRKAPLQARSKAMVEAILEATARILAERGYAGTNTNLVAECAGVGVGSVYQYFPNKDALVAALHERHAQQMHEAIDTALAATRPRTLRRHIEAIVHALLQAHRLQPELHRVLEKEFPFFDPPKKDSPADNLIFKRVRQLLEDNRGAIVPRDLDLATWLVLQTMESLVHAAVLDPPADIPPAGVEHGIADVLMGYLGAGR
jgi:AcrR family transcriptional regulator